jgi:hypothetical protein
MCKNGTQFNPEQLELFAISSLEDQKKQHIIKMLEERLDAPVDLALTRNRSLMINSRKNDGRFQVRMHQVFLHADRRIILAVADIIKKGSKPAHKLINSYIQSHNRQIQTNRKKKVFILNPKGKVYDLRNILDEVAEKYNLSQRGIKITWSHSRIRKGQKSIRLGAYFQEDKLIRVHPALDKAEVPKFFVEYIVYHELLHAAVPPVKRNGRNSFHPPDYGKQEQQFDRYEEAQEFEKFFVKCWLG